MNAETVRRNVLLSQLSTRDVTVIVSDVYAVELVAGAELYSPGKDIARVYFPLSGLSSLVATSRAGAVDVGPIGFDGMIGLPVYLDAPTGLLGAMVHVK